MLPSPVLCKSSVSLLSGAGAPQTLDIWSDNSSVNASGSAISMPAVDAPFTSENAWTPVPETRSGCASNIATANCLILRMKLPRWPSECTPPRKALCAEVRFGQ